MTNKQLLKAIECFVTINTLEITKPDMEYVSRLGYVVSMMDGDEKVFDYFSAMFGNEEICKIMINWLDARY